MKITAYDAGASVVGLMADGHWHSGPELARVLGVTRATVSARIAGLSERGVDVYSVSGKGYRLAQPLDLLNADVLAAGLDASTYTMLDELLICEQVASTNDIVASFEDGATRACLAEHQSAGRGRAGRVWVSPYAANLYLSVARVLDAPKGPLGALSLAVGVALADALTTLGVPDVGLKWPNDLWIGQAKVGGILIEHRGEAGGAARLIVGVGLNVAMNSAQSAAIDQAFTQIADHAPALPTRTTLAATCINAVLGALAEFSQAGFVGFAQRWPHYDRVAGRPIRLLETRGERSGIARGINADGSLSVEMDGSRHAIYSGDVSLRLGSSA